MRHWSSVLRNRTATRQPLFVTGVASEKFATCELRRIYSLSVPAECVNESGGSRKFGVLNDLEVHFNFYPRLELAKNVWPLKLPQQFTDWETLDQMPADTFVDLQGRVRSVAPPSIIGELAKA